MLGHGEWWREEEGCFVFHDSDSDPDFRESGPNLYHFRTATLPEVFQVQQESWKMIVEQKIPLPARKIKIYDESGSLTEVRKFPSLIQSTTERPPSHPLDCDSQPPSQDLHTPNRESSNQQTASEETVLAAKIPRDTCSASTPVPSTGTALQPAQPTPTQQHPTTISTTPCDMDEINISLPTCGTPASTPLAGRLHHNIEACTPHREAPTMPPCRLTMNGTESNDGSPTSPDIEDEDLFGIFPEEEREHEEEEVETIINTKEDEPVLVQENGQNSNQLQSSNAKHIASVIGVSEIVIRFDKLRGQLKDHRNPSRQALDEHKTLLSQIGQQILQARTSVLTQIKAFEHDYFSKHDTLPPNETAEYKLLTNKYRNAVKLLRKLKIDL